VPATAALPLAVINLSSISWGASAPVGTFALIVLALADSSNGFADKRQAALFVA
jgi:hypothetical protein